MALGNQAVVEEEIRGSGGHAHQELGDLDGGDVAFTRDMDANGGHGVVEVHDRVDQRVEDDKDPDGLGAIPDPGPHGDHGPSMMVGLQQRRSTALDKDDHSINHFIKLGEVKQVAPVSQCIIPQESILIAVLCMTHPIVSYKKKKIRFPMPQSLLNLSFRPLTES